MKDIMMTHGRSKLLDDFRNNRLFTSLQTISLNFRKTSMGQGKKLIGNTSRQISF